MLPDSRWNSKFLSFPHACLKIRILFQSSSLIFIPSFCSTEALISLSVNIITSSSLVSIGKIMLSQINSICPTSGSTESFPILSISPRFNWSHPFVYPSSTLPVEIMIHVSNYPENIRRDSCSRGFPAITVYSCLLSQVHLVEVDITKLRFSWWAAMKQNKFCTLWM